jgi:ribosomal protein L29
MQTEARDNRTPEELTRDLAALREELRALRFRVRIGQESHVRKIRALRTKVAQTATALRAAITLPNA